MNQWTEKNEGDYQAKLADHQSQLPPMEKFDPTTFGQRDAARKSFFSSLTADEKCRHNSNRPAIII